MDNGKSVADAALLRYILTVIKGKLSITYIKGPFTISVGSV